jgi:hypothetical protein
LLNYPDNLKYLFKQSFLNYVIIFQLYVLDRASKSEPIGIVRPIRDMLKIPPFPGPLFTIFVAISSTYDWLLIIFVLLPFNKLINNIEDGRIGNGETNNVLFILYIDIVFNIVNDAKLVSAKP